jgi:hypothetical protein
VGGWFKKGERLYVGGRDCSALVAAMEKQLGVVRGVLAEHADVPVTGALCFVDAEWALFARPFTLGEVLVTWPKAFIERFAADALDAERVAKVAAVLARALRGA